VSAGPAGRDGIRPPGVSALSRASIARIGANREAVGIRPIGRIDRLAQEIREILVEARFLRARLQHHEGCHVPGVVGRQAWRKVVCPCGHVGVDEVGRRNQPVHAGTVVEAVGSPERRDHVAGLALSQIRGKPEPSALWQAAQLSA